MTCGEALEALLREESGPVLLVAPFIKATITQRLLGLVDAHREVRIYTRWRPEEVAAGVSDLEVLDIVSERPTAELWLCPILHAKYYRVGNRVLVGSANLTGRGLGWHVSPNLELLVPVEWQSALFQRFEAALVRAAVPATVELQKLLRTAVEALPASIPDEAPEEMASLEDWLPSTRHPENLYRAYRGDFAQLTAAAREQTRVDLAAIQLPHGLSSEPAFRAAVSASMLQAPLIVELLRFGTVPRRFGEVRSHLQERLSERRGERTSSEAWQTTFRWLLYFLGDRVSASVTNYSEIFHVRQA